MLELIVELPWRAYPAAILALCGAALVASGLKAARGYARRTRSAPEWALAYLHVFRRVVVGLALIGAGGAWLWRAPELLAACVCIGIGEALESTFYIEVLRWGQRNGVPWLGRDRSAGGSGA